MSAETDESHPEHRCGRCGGLNPVWNVDSDRYNTAVNRSEIVCPTCFIKAHEAATGMCTVWQLVPMVPFRWIAPEGRTTPYVTEPDPARKGLPPEQYVHWFGPDGNIYPPDQAAPSGSHTQVTPSPESDPA